MKKNLFLHASKAIAGAIVFSLAFTACQKDIKREATSDEILLSNKGNKPTVISPVSLKVTIESFDGAKITSDNNTDYVNGEQNVKAVIDEYGNFIFNTQSSTTTNVQRSVVYNFSDPESNNYNPSVDPSKSVNLNMIKSNYSCTNWVPLQNMQLGEPYKQAVGLGGGFTGNNGKQHLISFHRSLEDTESSPTSFVVVTRISNTQWTIEPAQICTQPANVASLRSGSGTRKDPTVIQGYYNLPFKFILNSN